MTKYRRIKTKCGCKQVKWITDQKNNNKNNQLYLYKLMFKKMTYKLYHYIKLKKYSICKKKSTFLSKKYE